MSVNGLPSIPIDGELHRRLLIQASRRMRPGEDVRAVMAALARGTIVELVERLEGEDGAGHSRIAPCRCAMCEHSRFCRCEVCKEVRR